MKILVTGFEPFAGAALNPSGEIVKRLSGDNLVTAVLPVEYGQAAKRLLELIEEHRPDVVISLGQAEGRSTISLERIAVNLDDAALADNSGETRIDQPISATGEAAYFTTLPVRELATALKAEAIPVSLSLSAGAFVCNHIFYETQKALAGSKVRSGFVHVPLMTEQAQDFAEQPTMDLQTQIRAVELMIECLK